VSKVYSKILAVMALACCGVVLESSASDVVSFHDPAPLYSVYGQDRTPIMVRKSQLTLSLLPYYQFAKHAKNEKNEKVPLGDRMGMINMLGLLINDDASPYADGHKFGQDADDSVLHKAYSAFKTFTDDHTGDKVFLGSTYEPLDVTDARYGWGKYQTTMTYARLGVRGSLDYCFYNGVALAVRGGVAEYSVRQPYYLANPRLDGDAYVNAAVGTTDTSFVYFAQTKLMNQARQKEVGTELGIDFTGAKGTGLEDVSIELSWRKGFSMKDAEGDQVLTVTPLMALAVMLPTSEKSKVGKLFDIALGNNGFYGFTGQVEVSFDFPGMLKVGFGGTGTLSTEDAIGKQFVPTSEYQNGIYPWQTTITKRPGALWKAYATMRAQNFIDYLSCYVTYMYVSHYKDSITVTGANKALFLGEKLAEEGRYNAQLIHLGFEYDITQSLKCGLAIQSVFAGMRIWKTTTIAGSLSFVF
jgi:hypothetical protein